MDFADPTRSTRRDFLASRIARGGVAGGRALEIISGRRTGE